MNWKRTLSHLKILSRTYLRSGYGLFFSIIFPIILILIFGTVFSGSGSTPNVYVQNLDSGNIGAQFVQTLNSTGMYNVVYVPANESMSEYMSSHSYTNGIMIPAGFTASIMGGQGANITVYTNPTSSSGGTLIFLVTGIENRMNLNIAGANPLMGYDLQNVGSSSYKYVDFIIPGLISFSILISPMFAVTSLASRFKQMHIFSQLSLTPLKKSEWLVSNIMWYLILSAISFFAVWGIGKVLFNSNVVLTWWIIPFVVLGTFLFVALGLLVGTVAKTPESAGIVGNVITFPMMFLAGTFFPLETMPNYLQTFAHFLPLYYVVQGLTDVMVYSNFVEAAIYIGVLAALSAIIFVAAIYFFKWRES